MRFSQGRASPLSATVHDERCASPPPSRSTSTWPTTAGFPLAVSRTFRKWQSSVLPALPQPGRTLPSDTPDKGNHLPDVPPPTPEKLSPNPLLQFPLNSLSLAPDTAATPSNRCTTPEATQAVIRQHAACILQSISPPFLASPFKAPDMPAQRGAECQGGAQEGKEENLERSVAVLAHSHLCKGEAGGQQGALQRTMLACEGIAVNFLFDYGMPTCRVRHCEDSCMWRRCND
jgi:hypothetical protein